MESYPPKSNCRSGTGRCCLMLVVGSAAAPLICDQSLMACGQSCSTPGPEAAATALSVRRSPHGNADKCSGRDGHLLSRSQRRPSRHPGVWERLATQQADCTAHCKDANVGRLCICKERYFANRIRNDWSSWHIASSDWSPLHGSQSIAGIRGKFFVHDGRNGKFYATEHSFLLILLHRKVKTIALTPV